MYTSTLFSCIVISHVACALHSLIVFYHVLLYCRRCFDVLGFDEYLEEHADGLQILRYNLTKAYISHSDWIEGNDQVEHDHESAFKGGNRFATILLYMSDLGPGDGGETVFTEAWPVGQAEEDKIDTNKVKSQSNNLAFPFLLFAVPTSVTFPPFSHCLSIHLNVGPTTAPRIGSRDGSEERLLGRENGKCLLRL
jgi:hypothetical protein